MAARRAVSPPAVSRHQLVSSWCPHPPRWRQRSGVEVEQGTRRLLGVDGAGDEPEGEHGGGRLVLVGHRLPAIVVQLDLVASASQGTQVLGGARARGAAEPQVELVVPPLTVQPVASLGGIRGPDQRREPIVALDQEQLGVQGPQLRVGRVEGHDLCAALRRERRRRLHRACERVDGGDQRQSLGDWPAAR